MTSPTPPPLQPSVTARHVSPQRQPGHLLAIVGAWLQLGTLLGLGGTIYGMIRAFNQIAEQGQADPQVLTDNISASLITTMIGLPIAFAGLILMAIALFVMKYRAKWYFWFLIVYSTLMLTAIPVGTLLGIGLLIFLIVKRKEFFAPTSPVTSVCL